MMSVQGLKTNRDMLSCCRLPLRRPAKVRVLLLPFLPALQDEETAYPSSPGTPRGKAEVRFSPCVSSFQLDSLAFPGKKFHLPGGRYLRRGDRRTNGTNKPPERSLLASRRRIKRAPVSTGPSVEGVGVVVHTRQRKKHTPHLSAVCRRPR